MARDLRKLSLGAAIDKSKLESGVAYLFFVEIEVIDRFTGNTVETIRFIRNVSSGASAGPETVNFQGNAYTTASFDLQLTESVGEVPKVSLSANDVTGDIRARMEDYDGGVGSKVKIMLARSDVLALPAPYQKTEIVENFRITSGSIQDRKISFELGAREILSAHFPRRIQSRDMCQWTYKGAECGYVGAITSCDRTLQGANGCAAHDNTINFGGFPGIRNRNV